MSLFLYLFDLRIERRHDLRALLRGILDRRHDDVDDDREEDHRQTDVRSPRLIQQLIDPVHQQAQQLGDVLKDRQRRFA